MYLVLSIIIVVGVAIYIGSAIAIINRWTKINVSTNIVSILILVCPIINTLLALYYLYSELTETLSKIFKNN
jgi:hypothetical protein